MNHDDSHTTSDPQPFIEPELEARIVAWVLGEASPFEAAELERLIAEKPELAEFKRRIEAVNGLAGEAARPDATPLRLAPERRNKVLAAMGVDRTTEQSAPPVVLPAEAPRRQKPRLLWLPILTGVAACGIVALVMIPTGRTVMELSQSITADYEAQPRVRQARLPADEPPPPAREPFAEEELVAHNTLERPLPRERSGPVQMDQVQSMPVEANRTANEDLRDRPFTGSSSASEPTFRSEYEFADSAPPPTLTSRRGDLASVSVNGGPRSELVGEVPRNGLRGFYSESDASGGNEIAAASRPGAYPAPAVRISGRGGAIGGDGGEVVELSPFSVESSSDDVGYYASSTLAGSRLNTNLGDLASSVTVATKEQLQDAGSVSLDDVFLYEANTEGANQGRSAEERLGPGQTDIQARDEEPVVLSPFEVASKDRVRGFDQEIPTSEESVSTFSLHVSDVSFHRLLTDIETRENLFVPEWLRQEEFYNAFDYGDPAPTIAEKIACRIEQVRHPLLQGRNLVRIAMKVSAAGRGSGQPLRLTLMLDTSGSMERQDRAASLEQAIKALVSLLGPNDTVSVVGFARQPRLILEALPGNEAHRLPEVVKNTPPEGGTNIEEALKLSIELARRYYDPAAQNRIVMITDGAANLGNADPVLLSDTIETVRQSGISFDACGFAVEGHGDAMLEALTRKGDGRYYVVNAPADADAEFGRKLAGAFRPAAKNVKLQVRFNPSRVASYRLIGFEEHRLGEEDFRDDAVDAAELAAEEEAVAVYQLEPIPDGEGELGEVFVRFLDTSTNEMVERSWTMTYDANVPAIDQATPTMQLAGLSAIFADKYRYSDWEDLQWIEDLGPVANSLRGHYRNEEQVQRFLRMFEEMRRMARN